MLCVNSFTQLYSLNCTGSRQLHTSHVLCARPRPVPSTGESRSEQKHITNIHANIPAPHPLALGLPVSCDQNTRDTRAVGFIIRLLQPLLPRQSTPWRTSVRPCQSCHVLSRDLCHLILSRIVTPRELEKSLVRVTQASVPGPNK